MIGGAALLPVMVGNDLSSLMEKKSSPLCCWTHPARRVKPEIPYIPDPRISGPISSIWPKIPGLRAVWERLDRRRRNSFWVFPSNGTGKRSRLCTAGWERDGKAGRQKVDGMGWKLIIFRWDGNGREIKRSGNKSGNKSGNTWGNTSACREAQKSFRGFHHNCCFLAVGSCTLYV